MANEDILVAVDGSANAERAVSHAISLVKQGVANRLHLLNVRPARDGAGEAGGEALQSAEALCASASVPAQSHVDTGQPAAVIVTSARRFGCDSIVMGTHGNTGITRDLLGSVAQDVVSKGDLPVWLVK